MFHTFAWSHLQFDECFTLLRRRYPKVTNVLHFRCFRASLSLGDVILVNVSPFRLATPKNLRMSDNFFRPVSKREECVTVWALSGLHLQGYVFGKCCVPSLSRPSNSTYVSHFHFRMVCIKKRRLFHSFVVFRPLS